MLYAQEQNIPAQRYLWEKLYLVGIGNIGGEKMVDFKEIRAQFPTLDQEIHGQPLVYLDSAAT